jgi:aminopeptidase N
VILNKSIKIIPIIIILFSGCSFNKSRLTPDAPRPANIPTPERIRTYDVQHIKIDVSFDWNEKKVIGEVETRIVPLSDTLKEFEVDAVGFDIAYIRDEKNPDLKYDYDGKKIKIDLGKNYSLKDTIIYTVNYTCQPQRGLFFIYPTELNPSMPYQIWTQGEESDNRYWIPVYDYPNDKSTFEVYVTVDDKYETISNGFLNDSRKIPESNKRQDHWIMDKPNSTYLIMLAVGEFNIVNDKYGALPVETYADAGISGGDAQYTFRNTPEMMEIFEKDFRYKYPWNKYAQVVVEDFLYGGMENTTAAVINRIIIYNKDIEKNYSSDALIAHELSHQWFGDLVTCRNWNEMWLNESFATFGTSLWKEYYLGEDEYDYDILLNGDNALRVDSVTGRYPIWAGYGSVTANLYDKGSVIINSFRNILGEDFFPSLETYLNDNKFKNVETNDLLNAINKTYNLRHNSNEDFKWMFDQWIWKAGYPDFKVKYEYDSNAKQVILDVKQVQAVDSLTPVFRMPVDIRIKNSFEDKIERVEIKDDDETFRINLSSKPEMVVFDYGNNVLDKTFFDKPFDDWKNQYEESEKAVDRIMALRGLERFLKEDDSPVAGKPPITINQIESLKLFENALNNDKYFGVRIEAAKILGKNFILDRTSTVLKDSYDGQTNPRVKREILKSFGNSDRGEDIEFIKTIIQNETDEYILADAIGALGKCLPKEEVYDAVSPFSNRDSHRNVIRLAVLEALDSADNALPDDRIKKTITDIAFGIDTEGRLRASAINSLKTYAKDEDVKNLAMKYADFNFIIVKRALISLLSNSNDKSVIPFLKNMDEKTTDEELKKLLNASIKKLEDTK